MPGGTGRPLWRVLLAVVLLAVMASILSSCFVTSDLVTRQILDDAQRRRDRAQIPTSTGTPTPIPPTLTPTPTSTPRPGRTLAQVLRVWDGNTILIDGGYSVRYIGVNTPGAGMFRRPVEPFGREAAERNAELVEGQQVELEEDATDLDGAGNLLRYVYIGDTMVNELLLREGLARVAPMGRNTRYAALLTVAEQDARAAPAALWTLVTPTPTPTRLPTSTLPRPPTRLPTRPRPPLPPGFPAATAITGQSLPAPVVSEGAASLSRS
jgi:endonuclease YncB( thermonuclease family)